MQPHYSTQPASDLDKAIELLKVGQTLTHENATKQFENSKSYITLVMSLGYAGLFALWSFSEKLIPSRASALVGILAGVSLMLFIVFEILKMFALQKIALRQLQNANLNPQIRDVEGLLRFADAHQRQQTAFAAECQAVMNSMMKVWRVVFPATVISGFGAGAVVLYNMFAHLTGVLPYLPH